MVRAYDAAWAAFVRETAPKLRQAFYDAAPKRSGTFANGIRVEADQEKMAVAAPGPLALWLIKGTGSFGPRGAPYPIFPRRPGGFLRFQLDDGTVVFTRRVMHPGIKPNPFHERAIAAVGPEMMQTFSRLMGQELMKIDTTLRPSTEIKMGG